MRFYYFVDRGFNIYDICYTNTEIDFTVLKKISLHFVDKESHKLEANILSIYKKRMPWMLVNNSRDTAIDFLVHLCK